MQDTRRPDHGAGERQTSGQRRNQQRTVRARRPDAVPFIDEPFIDPAPRSVVVEERPNEEEPNVDRVPVA